MQLLWSRGRNSWLREEPARGVSHIPGWDSMTEPDTNKQRERERLAHWLAELGDRLRVRQTEQTSLFRSA